MGFNEVLGLGFWVLGFWGLGFVAKPLSSHMLNYPKRESGLRCRLPIGPIVVPFWDSLINSKYETQKGTTMGP